MPAETERRLEKKEAERAEKRKLKSAEKTEKKQQKAEKPKAKKWKGKDWFAVLSPKFFGETYLADTPAMDPKSVVGRSIEVSVPEVTGNESKYYMKLRFKIDNVSDKKAFTRFDGLFSTRDFISRMVRKRSSKIRIINNIETKDNWSLRMSMVAVLLKNTDATTQKRVRENITQYLDSNAKKSTTDDLIKAAVNGFIQKNLKKSSSKIYPVRFMEIEKIEVLKAPAD